MAAPGRVPALAVVIVGRNELVYERRLAAGREEQAHVHQFVLHSALDMVEEKVWSTTAMALSPHVDEFNEFQVRAWVAADGARFLLLHEKVADDLAKRTRTEDNIRSFFEEVNELYTKIVLNPFYEVDAKITSPSFDRRVAALATKWGLG